MAEYADCDVLYDELDDIGGRGAGGDRVRGRYDAVSEAIRIPEKVPAAGAEPVIHAVWRRKCNGLGGHHDHYWHGSHCDYPVPEVIHERTADLYCPPCGSRMNSEERGLKYPLTFTALQRARFGTEPWVQGRGNAGIVSLKAREMVSGSHRGGCGDPCMDPVGGKRCHDPRQAEWEDPADAGRWFGMIGPMEGRIQKHWKNERSGG